MATVIRHYTQNHFCCDVVQDELFNPTECFYTLLEISPKFIGQCMNDGSYTIRYPDGDYCVIDELLLDDGVPVSAGYLEHPELSTCEWDSYPR